jgi:prepilin-type processing-associated H-X9-DG protein
MIGPPIHAMARADCLNHLKTMAISFQFYANDHDDRLPPRDEWLTQLEPYTEYPATPHCTVVKDPDLYGYSFNSGLEFARQSTIKAPQSTPLIYDSENLARNASDPFASLPTRGRHGGSNNVCYADGHARSLKVIK